MSSREDILSMPYRVCTASLNQYGAIKLHRVPYCGCFRVSIQLQVVNFIVFFNYLENQLFSPFCRAVEEFYFCGCCLLRLWFFPLSMDFVFTCFEADQLHCFVNFVFLFLHCSTISGFLFLHMPGARDTIPFQTQARSGPPPKKKKIQVGTISLVN